MPRGPLLFVRRSQASPTAIRRSGRVALEPAARSSDAEGIEMSSAIRIAILGEYDASLTPHTATNSAIEHSREALHADVEALWVGTHEIDDVLRRQFSGIWVAPGGPYKNMDKALWAIREARENNIPCLGTCAGFQHMVLEYARHVLGFQDAQHAECDPYASNLFISKLACSLVGREMQLHLTAGSRVAAMYGALDVSEQYYCDFGVNPEVAGTLRSGAMHFVGSDAEGELRVLELPNHPFFVGTLFVPQVRSTPTAPHRSVRRHTTVAR